MVPMTDQKPVETAEYETVAIVREKEGVRKDALFILSALAMFAGWLLGVIGYSASESSLSILPILLPVVFSIALVAGTDWYAKRYPGSEAVIASGALTSAGIIVSIGLMMLLSNGDDLSATPYSFVLLSLFFPLIALTTNRLVVDITYRLGLNVGGKRTIDHIDTLYVRSRGEKGYAIAPEVNRLSRVQAYVEAAALSEDRQMRDYSQVVKHVGHEGKYEIVKIDFDALETAPIVTQKAPADSVSEAAATDVVIGAADSEPNPTKEKKAKTAKKSKKTATSKSGAKSAKAVSGKKRSDKSES